MIHELKNYKLSSIHEAKDYKFDLGNNPVAKKYADNLLKKC